MPFVTCCLTMLKDQSCQYHNLPLLQIDCAVAKVCSCVLQTKDGMKMGKSLGNILEPHKLLDAYGSDAVRFYFLKEVVFGQARPSLSIFLPVCMCY